jgi:signal recognition particle receptor subunit beta
VAFTNFETKEINCKVLYFGPRGAGKTETLRSIYRSTSAEVRSGLLELEDAGGPTRFFDFLPISLGHVKDFHLKLHLFTLPINSLYESVTSVILKGIDGFVFVADSRIEAMADNVESLQHARRLLSEDGHNVADMPRVLQYNQRDVPDVVPLEVLRQELNPGNLPEHKSIATQSIGTMESLQSMAKLVLHRLAP